MNTVVTHMRPDADACAAVWLITRFKKDWKNAQPRFVPAEKTLHDKPPDDDPEIIHVDTGYGRFDHHQTNADTSAAKLVLADLLENDLKNQSEVGKEALSRLTEVIKDTDHFREVFWPRPDADYHELNFISLVSGWEQMTRDDNDIINWALNALDGFYQSFVSRVEAEKEIREGLVFESVFGRTLAVNTKNAAVTHLSQKQGFMMVVRKHPGTGAVSIKTRPDAVLSLKPLFNKLKSADPSATWFYHVSGHMLLNGSAKNPEMKATKLTLDDIIEAVKQVKDFKT